MLARALVPSVAFVASLTAQTTHLVGPGGLPQIRDALAIAAPGDVIHVQAGTYAHFTANVGVTIRALVPGTVIVAYDAAFESPACVADPFCAVNLGPTRFAAPSGQAIHVVGIEFVPTPAPSRHRVLIDGGAVTFDDCAIRCLDNFTALVIADAQVHLQGCTVASQGAAALQPVNNHGLWATDSSLTLVDTSIGGGASFLGGFGGSAVNLVNCTLKASGCLFAGGDPMGIDGSAVRPDPAGRVWISASTLTAGSACAILGTPSVGQLARTTVTANGSGCGTFTTASLVAVERPNPIQNGAAFDVLVHTEPNTLVAIHASPRLAHVEIPGLFAQPIALDLTSFFLAGLFVSDGNGDVTASWNMPAGQFVDETIWLEATAWLPGQPVLVGPVVGGVIR